jgi:hypothetical protein
MKEPQQLDLKVDVPTGLAHIDMLVPFNQHNRELAQSLLQAHRAPPKFWRPTLSRCWPTRRCIGTSM